MTIEEQLKRIEEKLDRILKLLGDVPEEIYPCTFPYVKVYPHEWGESDMTAVK